MKFTFQSSGGLIGKSLLMKGESSSIPLNYASLLKALFETSPSDITKKETGKMRDHINYKIELEENGVKKIFIFSEHSAPDHFAPLLNYLRNKALAQ